MSTVTPPVASSTEAIVARLLLEVGAVRICPESPVELSSGRRSPLDFDCRRLISYPGPRQRLMRLAVECIQNEAGFERFDAVAGGETAGIPYAAWLADRLMLSMLYVRKKPKGFGRNARIEGRVSEGQRVLLVEDITVDGTSMESFADALRDAGTTVLHGFAICAFDAFPESRNTLGRAGVTLHRLCSWRDVVAEAVRLEAAPDDKLDALAAFAADPVAWSKANGG